MVSSQSPIEIMKRTCNLFAFHVVLLLGFISCLAKKTPNITTDQAALLAFKAYVTSDPDQFLSRNWSAASSVCDWVGVTCGPRHFRVAAVDISNMSLAGAIPPHLGNLSFLVSLNLNNNSFRGNLPPELSRLHRLKVLRIDGNDLCGEIPMWLDSLGELRLLSLKNNNFSGLIPSSLFNLSKLATLNLSNNSLKGMIPVEAGNLHNLRVLAIQNNQLSGSLPRGIFNISTLEVMALRENSLSGGIPNDMCGHIPRLEWLSLYSNQFSGQIPLNLSQCSKLKVLDLSSNKFGGTFIPKSIGSLKVLESLFLESNDLKGVIPKEVGNLTALKSLSLSYNNLTGEIPQELGNLNKLESLSSAFNNLSGQIPKGVFNLSAITWINLNSNFLQGHLSSGVDFSLPNLELIQIYQNHLSGVIPSSMSNSSRLFQIELSRNNFVGCIPYSLGNLENLKVLNVHSNHLTCKSSSQELDFFRFLSGCKKLRVLSASDNRMDGLRLDSIGNLSKSIERIYADNCSIKGSIPGEIGNLSNLFDLSIHGNELTGSIPSTIQGLSSMQSLQLGNNKLSGVIPKGICGLQKLTSLNLEGNQISGSIPDCLGNVSSLRKLSMGSNKLNSVVPTNLMNLHDLLSLNLSSNFIIGSLPINVGNLKVAVQIDLSMNYLSGNIPSTIADLTNLEALSLAHNRLQGSIPESIDKIISLEYLDLSHNNLSGLIPKSLEKLQYLKYLNVSFNQLRGEIPWRGPFQNFTSESFIFNEALCGSVKFKVPACPTMQIDKSKTKKVYLIVFLLLGVTAVIGSVILGVYRRHRKNRRLIKETNTLPLVALERISYYDLLHATNGYNESNLLGMGSFGTVYKGNLPDGRIVAVKVFNLHLDSAFKSFKAECEVLRNLRHRNLTKIINACSNPDFKALVLEFMPNGSLDKWLYSHNHFLDIVQRLNIMIDVACAMQYLHFGNQMPVIHCDLKPSNILLDEYMVGHVSDFGIAKLFDQEQSNVYTQTLATFGYVAPEYGLEGQVSTRSDVYSYGILLIEIFTRKKPSDEMFNENFSMREWVKDSIPDALFQVVDANLVKEDEEYYDEKLKCLLSIFRVALNCSAEFPKQRINMEEVLAALNQIKHQFSPYLGQATHVKRF